MWTLSSAFSHAHHSQDAECSVIFFLMLPTQALQCIICTYPWVWGAVPSKGRGEERSDGDPLSSGPFPTRLTGPILGFSAPSSASLSPPLPLPLSSPSPSSPLSPSFPLLSPPPLSSPPSSSSRLSCCVEQAEDGFGVLLLKNLSFLFCFSLRSQGARGLRGGATKFQIQEEGRECW